MSRKQENFLVNINCVRPNGRSLTKLSELSGKTRAAVPVCGRTAVLGKRISFAKSLNREMRAVYVQRGRGGMCCDAGRTMGLFFLFACPIRDDSSCGEMNLDPMQRQAFYPRTVSIEHAIVSRYISIINRLSTIRCKATHCIA